MTIEAPVPQELSPQELGKRSFNTIVRLERALLYNPGNLAFLQAVAKLRFFNKGDFSTEGDKIKTVSLLESVFLNSSFTSSELQENEFLNGSILVVDGKKEYADSNEAYDRIHDVIEDVFPMLSNT